MPSVSGLTIRVASICLTRSFAIITSSSASFSSISLRCSAVKFSAGKNFQAVRCPCLAPRAVRIALSKSPVEKDAKALSANVGSNLILR